MENSHGSEGSDPLGAQRVAFISLMSYSTVVAAIDTVRRGGLCIVVDEGQGDCEGILAMAAESVTPEKISFLLTHTSGVICAAILPELADRLDLPYMVSANPDDQRHAFTVSVDARLGTTTGISASDRALTITTLVHPSTQATDFNRPGHIFPLRYRIGGVLSRANHTEAAVDLVKASGMYPASVLSEIVSEDKTTMARLPELENLSRQHRLPMISINDLIQHRRHHETLVRKISEARIPTKTGDYIAHVFESVLSGEQHLALVFGEIGSGDNVLVRIHPECIAGDVLHSQSCKCGIELRESLALIATEGRGVLLYLRGQKGRGIDPGHGSATIEEHRQGNDAVLQGRELPTHSKEYGIGAQILANLGVATMRVIVNSNTEYGDLRGFGLDITERVILKRSPASSDGRIVPSADDILPATG